MFNPVYRIRIRIRIRMDSGGQNLPTKREKKFTNFKFISAGCSLLKGSPAAWTFFMEAKG
jgi:hypothetical protein